MEPERLIVGRIVKAHGIRGEVAVEVSSDAPDRFAAGAVLYRGADRMTVEASRAHHGRLLVKFAEVGDRTAAEALRGATLTIDAGEAAPLPDDAYYPHQLDGCAVVDTDGGEVGVWVRAEHTPAHDVWVVRAGAREVLVPAVREIVREVDLEARRIVIEPPPGLIDR